MKVKAILITAITAVAIAATSTTNALASTGGDQIQIDPAQIQLTPAGNGVQPDFTKIQPGQREDIGPVIVVEPEDGGITLEEVPGEASLDEVIVAPTK
ncbi:hypothetical protein ABZX12_04305 [Kribbella sp. NPDC003505]|uniref:hypothetical protein n=1 Tax=Kribbella sp. NPDC003505 TaxID=3154448 RepID=UPI0033B80A26